MLPPAADFLPRSHSGSIMMTRQGPTSTTQGESSRDSQSIERLDGMLRHDPNTDSAAGTSTCRVEELVDVDLHSSQQKDLHCSVENSWDQSSDTPIPSAEASELPQRRRSTDLLTTVQQDIAEIYASLESSKKTSSQGVEVRALVLNQMPPRRSTRRTPAVASLDWRLSCGEGDIRSDSD